MRPATSVCGLKLLSIGNDISPHIGRPATSALGLQLLVHEVFKRRDDAQTPKLTSVIHTRDTRVVKQQVKVLNVFIS
eukprot:22375_6